MLVSMMMVGSRFISTEAFSDNKTVNITGIFDPASGQTFTDSDLYPYGSNVSMDLTGTPAGQNFAFWIENGIVKPAYAVNHVFTITNNMNLQVVFTPADKVVAVFMDVNGGYLGSRYVTSGGAVDTTLIALPERPGFDAVDGAGRWTMVYGSESVTNITQNSVYVQNYVDDAATNTVNIVVNNGTGTEVKNFNSIVTAVAGVAPEGQKFSHWEENGVKISAQETYQFTALYDREITAIYVPVATVLTDEVIVTLSNDVEKRPGYHTYVGQLDIPSGYEVIEYGFFIGDNADLLDETHYSHIVQGTNIHPLTSEFVSSMSIGSHMSVRAYVVVSDGETQTIVKSEVNQYQLYNSLKLIDFESADYPAGTNYSTTLEVGPTGEKWEFYYGTPSTTGPISGTKSAQMRYYTGSPANLGYVKSLFTISGYDLVIFKASAYNGLQLSVAYSLDGENWMGSRTYNLSTSASTISYPLTSSQSVYLKFQLEVKEGSTPANAARLYIDDLDFSTVYKGEKHQVVFNEDSQTSTQQIIKDGEQASTYTPTKTGNSFDGWYSNNEFTGDIFNFSTNITSDVQLYAKWAINQYTISFDTNGGSSVTAITQDYNTEVTAPSSPTKTGYSFDGWYSDSGLTTLFSFTTMPASNLTLYAKWAINQYTITFDSNGGSAVTAITQDYGTEVIAPTNPTKTDYTFNGWYSDSELTSAYTFNTMPAGSITLYADWVSAATSATVTYDSDGGSEVSSEVVELNGLITEPADPTKTGYTFVRWVDQFDVEWNFASDTVTEDITLTAVWTINEYTISFNSNGGSAVTAITQNYNTVVVAPTDPTKTDYTFGGWYSDSELTSAYTFSTMPAENITLFAKWNSTAIVATDLFISEYIEGSSNNKVIEIYNGTGASINLSNYTVELYANGASSPTNTQTFTISDILSNGSVLLLVNSSATAAFKVGNYKTSAVANFNGDDTIVLKNNGTIIDIFGQVGFDPGSAWVGTITTSPTTTTVDRTLVRNASITTGRTSSGAFDPSQEWTAYAIDTSSYLGSHTFNPE